MTTTTTTTPTVTIECSFKYALEKGGFHVAAQVGNSTIIHGFQLDTGSSGMAVGKENAGDYMNYPCYGPGQFHYEPSGNLLEGNWYLLPVTLYSQSPIWDDAKQATAYTPVAQSQCMVLVVETYIPGSGGGKHHTHGSVDVKADTDGSTDDKHSGGFGGGMMGVSAKSENINYNVLLNATTMDGIPLAPAYVLTPPTDGSPATCTIGQTHVAGDGFNCVNLQPVAAPPLPVTIIQNQTIYSNPALNTSAPPPPPPASQTNLSPNPVNTTWAMPPVVATFAQPLPMREKVEQQLYMTVILTATLEIDTGIDGMLVGAPAGTFPESFYGPPMQGGKASFVDGVVTTICVPGNGVVTGSTKTPNIAQEAILSYTFTTGAKDGPPAPSTVVLMPAPANTVGDMVRINTGIRPLYNCQYMYDALNGVIGLAPLTQS